MRFVLSSLTLADPPGRHRLHSRLFALQARAFSVLLFGGAAQLLWYQVAPAARVESGSMLAKSIALLIAIVALAWYVWQRPKSVFATKRGLEVGSGKKRRVIPWSRVLDVREMPSVRLSAFANPSRWQVDLDRDERFDFCGIAKARAIVKEYIARAERRAG
ncbi:MAG: hypothetical protein ABJB12_17100 [Pseudomonadota bacterium]